MSIYRHIYPVAGIFVILTAASLGSTHVKAIAAATPLNVFVTNSAANPVPVAAQGTTNVAGSVAVTNQPTVNLSNDQNTPVPIRDVDVASRTPVRIAVGLLMDEGVTEGYGSDAYTVPAGKRLVVQTLTLDTFQFPSGEKLIEFDLDDKTGYGYSVPFQSQGEDVDGFEHFTGVLSSTLYFDAGHVLLAHAYRNSGTGQAPIGVVVTGYLENQ